MDLVWQLAWQVVQGEEVYGYFCADFFIWTSTLDSENNTLHPTLSPTICTIPIFSPDFCLFDWYFSFIKWLFLYL